MSTEKEGAGAPINEGATPASAGSTATSVAGAASVQTVRVVLPLTSEQRLEAMRKGLLVEQQGLTPTRSRPLFSCLLTLSELIG